VEAYVPRPDLDALKEQLLKNLAKEQRQKEENESYFTQDRILELIKLYSEYQKSLDHNSRVIKLTRFVNFVITKEKKAQKTSKNFVHYSILNRFIKLIQEGMLAKAQLGKFAGCYCLPEHLEQIQSIRAEPDFPSIIEGISYQIEQATIERIAGTFKPIELSKWAKRYRDNPERVKAYIEKYRNENRVRRNKNARNWRKKNKRKALVNEFKVKTRAQLAKEIIQANPVIFVDGALIPTKQVVHKASQILQAIADTKE
jgi:hypothetical protein